MAWKDLTMTQKAELMKIFAKGGITDLKEMRKRYDSGGYKTSLTPREEAQFQKWYDEYATARPMSNVSKNPDDIEHYYDYRGYWKNNKYRVLPPDRHFPDTYKLPGHPTFSDESLFADETAGHWDRNTFVPANKFETGGLKGIFGKVFGKREEPATPQKPLISDEQLRSLVDDLTASLDDEYTHYLDKYDYGWHTYKLGERESNYDGDRYYDVVKARYDGLSKAMDSMNFSSEEKERLMPFLLTQNILEGGWRVNKAATERGGLNNFGGMRVAGTKKFQNFENPDDFYVAYLKNLDEKWGDAYLGKGKGWRHAKDLADYARIINMEDLGLETKEQWREYSRKHPEKPAYIYTPLWENSGTELMSPQKFGGIYPRVYAYYEFMRQRQKNLEDLLKLNNVYNDPRLVEWGIVKR